MGETGFCHIVTGHGLQALADVWPRCDREVTTLTDLEGGSKKTKICMIQTMNGPIYG